MLARLRRWNDFSDLPSPLRAYIRIVACFGPIAGILLARVGQFDIDRNQGVAAAMLTALAIIAERCPLHLTHKTNINVGTAVYLAMFVVLPWQIPTLLVVIAASIAQGLRIYSNPEVRLAEPMFNVGQTSLYVAAGALAVAALENSPWFPATQSSSEIAVLISATATMHLANTGLVATAAGLQMGVSSFRVWLHNIALDLTPQVTLTVLGGMAAKLAEASAYLLPTLAIPGLLVHRAVQQTVRLRVDTHEALASLVEVIELRDPYTAGHSRRVAATSRLIAIRLGLTAEESDTIESAGRVHDIGKIAIDPLILVKSSKLDEDEWNQMKLHPVHGANVVERFAAYQRGASFVRHHHESWNGTGYPDGLAGTEIPLGARILAVADTFDAVTSDRPYRRGSSVATAKEILRNGAGVNWDPAVVDALLGLLEDAPNDVPMFRLQELTSNALAGAL